MVHVGTRATKREENNNNCKKYKLQTNERGKYKRKLENKSVKVGYSMAAVLPDI